MTDHFGAPDEQDPRYCPGGDLGITGGDGSADDPFIVAPGGGCTCGRGAAGGPVRGLRQFEDSGPPLQQVVLETEAGTEVLLYGPGPDFEDAGLLYVPRDEDEVGEQ
ncbi:hypothetical protein SUDANB1_05656 [Streptomyces sp. enrichment culture]|uniref:hypothetical protein n=1 Tax=Streptomyces sp. enrichment culture TaxID=1795815 RepID=UPI003F565B24